MQVLPLAVASPGSLDPVLAEEVECWRSQLLWDYEPALALIRRHINGRTLPGFFLMDRTDAVGYCYYVVAPPLAYLGAAYVRVAYTNPEAYGLLLGSALRAMRGNREVKRIESQVFGFNCDVSPWMTGEGFKALRRHFLTLSLDTEAAPDGEADLPGFRVVPWDRGYFLPAADVIYNSYQTAVDRAMCYDYQSREGCVRFLRNLIDNPGCGRFSAGTSRVALDAAGRVCGMLVTSVISPGIGMIPQISVRHDCQGKGIGTRLLQSSFAAAREQGLRRVTLSVSEQNRGAHALYRRLGFEHTKTFHAFIWEAAAQ